MTPVLRSAAVLLALTMGGPVAASEDRPAMQVVLISFDGALHNEQWVRSRALARATGARFTYFLSCTYLLTWDTRGEYRPPDRGVGASNVGFGFSREDVAARLDHLWQAYQEGHEIANHGCGHFDGGGWSAGEWAQEFAEFDRIVAEAWAINGLDSEPEAWRDLVRSTNGGFRAPYLSVGEGLHAALSRHGFSYDASSVSRGPARPQVENGMTTFALPLIPEGPQSRPVIAMDYNLFVRHSGGFERADADGQFEARTLAAFQDAFDEQYQGERIPLQIGFHFTLMNGGAYWNALERFVREVCVRQDVACMSYRDAIETMETDAITTGSSAGG